MPYVKFTETGLLRLATYLQRHGFSTGLPLDQNPDSLEAAAQEVMDSARDVINQDTARRRSGVPARPVQACGQDTPYGTCTLVAGHAPETTHRRIGQPE